MGQSLVKLFDSRSEELYAKYGLKPRVVGVFDSKGSAVNKSGLTLSKLIEVKKKFGTVKNYSEKNNYSEANPKSPPSFESVVQNTLEKSDDSSNSQKNNDSKKNKVKR